MRIAIFTDIYAPWSVGGIATSVKAQKEALEKLGHKVTVFCPGFNAREKGVVTVPSFKHFKVNGAVVGKMPPEIERFIEGKYPDFNKFDVVHVNHELPCSVAGIRLAQKFDVPLVQTMHGREDVAIASNIPHPWKRVLATYLNHLHAKYLPHSEKVKRDRFQAPTHARAKIWEVMVNHANNADIVVTPSQHFGNKLEHYGVSRPLRTVSNAVPDELGEMDFAKRKLEDGDVLKMIWHSRVSREKRIMPFLRALAELRRPYIVYIFSEGNELKKAKRFAKKHGLKVKFYGQKKREQILHKMAECHLCVMASYNFDTQGMTLLEAEATGLPVFFCDPDMMEVVPAESYIIAGGPEAEAMAIALENFPSEKVEKMSKKMLKNRAEVLQSTQIKNLEKVYREAIRTHKVAQQ